MAVKRPVFFRVTTLILSTVALVMGVKVQSRPAPPSSLVVVSITGSTVTLQWQPGSTVQGYVIEAGSTTTGVNIASIASITAWPQWKE